MREFKAAFLLIFYILFLFSPAFAADPGSKYRIIQENDSQIYDQFDQYSNDVDNNATQGGAIVSQTDLKDANENPLPKNVQDISGQQLLDYLDKIGYTPYKWQTRDMPLEGAGPSTEKKSSQELPPSIYAKLPFESELSLSGRKLIGFDFTSRQFDNQKAGIRTNNSDFKMSQELQMRIMGKVGDRLAVNVDYDDTADKKDISLIYTGKEGEFIQTAAFGDISVMLSPTEFTGYSKELFGLKVDAQHKALKLNAFFSRTKGASEMKRFTGNTQLERRTIPDTSYIRLKYFALRNAADQTRPLLAGSAQVFIDYQRLDPSLNISITTGTPLDYLKTPAASMTPPRSLYRGNFVLLVAGQDYTIDYNTGIITFKIPIAGNYVIAVNYQFADGTRPTADTAVIIKDVNNTDEGSLELKTFYDLGNIRINRDNGRGNFILELRDANGDIPTSLDGTANPVPVYPATINVDFENGIFNLVPVDGLPLSPDLYTANVHRYNFITEYSFNSRVLYLRPQIVPQSEKVVVDGRTLTSGADYIIDYDLGILTIIKEGIILETSVIEVTYDYSSFGADSESTLLGARAELNLTNEIKAGGSLLYNFTAKGTTLPDIRSTPSSLLVGEADLRVSDMQIQPLNMRFNGSAEYALSSQNDNTSGKASIDSMDSSLDESVASMDDEMWFNSAVGPQPALVMPYRNLWDLTWKGREMLIRDIDPALEIVDGQKVLVMDINYDMTTNTELAFAQKLSANGLDFSKKLYIEVWIKDNGMTSDFAIEYKPFINEDADRNGTLGTEDRDGNGIISPWEDTGQPFYNKDGTISYIGAGNGRLDTEDLNGNGILDTDEPAVPGGMSIYGGGVQVIKDDPVTGWKQLRIPLNITPADMPNWRNIRFLRFKITRNRIGAVPESGTISIGKIAIVGNRWEASPAASQDFEISSIGQSDILYRSLLTNSYYRDLYNIQGTVRKDERALRIEYNMLGFNIDALARAVYPGDPLDISKYDSIRFFVYAKYAQPGDVIVFRAGGNDNNYFEYRVAVSSDPSWQDWKLITIKQPGTARAVSWVSDDPNATITVVGQPRLERISQFTLGVLAPQGTNSRQIWFNEIHVVGSKTLDGPAWKTAGNLKWNGSGAVGSVSVGVNRKEIARDFQTVSAGIYDRDYTEDSITLDFEGLKAKNWTTLGVNAGFTRVKTVTPAVLDNTSNLISLNEEGEVETYTAFANTNLNFGVDLPNVNARYSRSIINTSLLERLEDRETLAADFTYNNPLEFPLLPTNLTANGVTTKSYFKKYPYLPGESSQDNSFLGLSNFQRYLNINDFHTLENSNTLSIRLPFRFSKGITFIPSYLIGNVSEKNRDFQVEQEYNKSLNQTVGASLILGVANWFSPTVMYSVNTRESYDMAMSTNPLTEVIPGQKKFIERSGVGEVSWNLNAYDIASSPFLKSLTFSALYRIQDSDSYDNVDKNFRSIGFTSDKLWIRDNLLMEMQPSFSTSSYIIRTILKRDDARVAGRYMPFEAFGFKGVLRPLNTVTANFTYTQSSENSFVTGTTKDVYTRIWPELLIGISGVEMFLGSVTWMSDTQINFKYNNKDIQTYGVSTIASIGSGIDYRFKLFKKLDLYASYETTTNSEVTFNTGSPLSDGSLTRVVGQGGYDLGKWRLSLRYENEKQWQKNGLGIYSSQTLKNSWLGQVNADVTFPGGITLPFIKVNIPLRNRMLLLSNAKFILQESPVNVATDNNRNYGLTLSADYEVSKNFRFLLGGGFERMEYPFNRDLNYTDISISSKLTIQF